MEEDIWDYTSVWWKHTSDACSDVKSIRTMTKILSRWSSGDYTSNGIVGIDLTIMWKEVYRLMTSQKPRFDWTLISPPIYSFAFPDGKSVVSIVSRLWSVHWSLVSNKWETLGEVISLCVLLCRDGMVTRDEEEGVRCGITLNPRGVFVVRLTGGMK